MLVFMMIQGNNRNSKQRLFPPLESLIQRICLLTSQASSEFNPRGSAKLFIDLLLIISEISSTFILSKTKSLNCINISSKNSYNTLIRRSSFLGGNILLLRTLILFRSQMRKFGTLHPFAC